MGLKVLAAGIDTLQLHTKKPIRQEVVKAGYDAKEQAAQTSALAPVVSANFGRFALPMRAYGTRRGPIVAENKHLAVTLNPVAKDPFPTVSVELRAQGLWSAGWENAGAAATRALEYCVGGAADVQVSRVDVCVDFQGWVPHQSTFSRFVSRSRTRRPFFAPDTEELEERWKGALAMALGIDGAEGAWAMVSDAIGEAGSSSYFAGQRLTGFSFGSGDVVARLYDKTAEIKVSGKGWFRQLWRRNGFDEALPVWRLEFQLRRQALKDLKPERDFGEWEALRMVVPSLWNHLTHDQLRHAARKKDDRQAVTPTWRELQAVKKFDQVVDMASTITRQRTVEAHAQCVPQLAGYMARVLAEEQSQGRVGLDWRDLHAQEQSALELMRRYFEKRGTSLHARAAELRKRMGDEEEVLKALALKVVDDVPTKDDSSTAVIEEIQRQRNAYSLRRTLELGDKKEVRWLAHNEYARTTLEEAQAQVATEEIH